MEGKLDENEIRKWSEPTTSTWLLVTTSLLRGVKELLLLSRAISMKEFSSVVLMSFVQFWLSFSSSSSSSSSSEKNASVDSLKALKEKLF